MKYRLLKIFVLAVFYSILGMTRLAAAPNLITNSGFEFDSAVPAWANWYYLDPDGDGSNLRYDGSFMGAGAHSGSWYLWGGEIVPETVTHHAGLVSQFNLATAPGKYYDLTFWVRNLPGAIPDNALEYYWLPTSQNFLNAVAGNAVDNSTMLAELALLPFAPNFLATNIAATLSTDPENGYTQYHFVVRGTGHDNLVFELTNPPTATLLDDVSLSASVPEPSTFGFLGAGLTAVYLMRRRARL